MEFPYNKLHRNKTCQKAKHHHETSKLLGVIVSMLKESQGKDESRCIRISWHVLKEKQVFLLSVKNANDNKTLRSFLF